MSSSFNRNEVGELGGELRSGLNHGSIPEQYMNITGSQGQSGQRGFGTRKPVPIDSSGDRRNEYDSDVTVPTEHQPSYQPRHFAELPTHEQPSGSRVGVGSLPGGNNESGVASLPDQREGGSLKGKASRVRGGGPTDGNEFDSDTTIPTEHQPSYQPRHATELPTHEKPSGSRVGVGSLPGSNTESGVASLPDEREGGTSKGKASRVRGGGPTGGNPFDSDMTIPTEHQPAYQPRHATQLPTHEHPSGSRVGIGSLPGGTNEVGVAFLPDERGRKLPEHLRKGHAARPHTEGRNQWDSDMTIPTEHQPAYQPRHPTELPTHELPSGSRVGIGSLPGKNTEIEVAELPDERNSDTPKKGKAARPRGGGVEVLTAPPPHQPFYQPRHAVQLPTHERPSGSRVGVGSLPGNNNEFGVARLPDERGAGNPYVHSQSTVGAAAWSPFRSALRKYDLPTQEQPSGSSVGVGSMPGDISEPGVATLPEERENGKPYGTGRTGFENYSPAKGALPHPKGRNPHQSAENMAGTMYNRSNETGGATGALSQSHEITSKHVEDHHVMSKWDMPSKEKISGSRCGVGSLPGKRSEQGVAMLPEERLHNADDILNSHLPPRMDQLPSREHITGSKVGVGSLPGKRSEQGVALTPEERLHPADDILNSHLPPRMDQMPSREHPSGSTVGVGSLPGKRGEQGVALTPEERLHPARDILMSHLPPRMDQMPSTEHMSGSVVGVGSLPGQRNERAVALTPEERQHPADQILASHRGQSRKAHRQQQLAKKSAEQLEQEKQKQATPARGLSGWTPPDTFPRQQEGRQQGMQESVEDREARLRAEERKEMMRKTMERIEGEVMHTVHGVEQGFEQMKHKVKETFGWEHPGTSAAAPAGVSRAGRMPGGFPAGRTASSESVQRGGTGADLSEAGDQRSQAQSHLSATAAEFVPTGRRASVSDARMMKTQRGQEHPQDTAAGGWWPTAIPAIPSGTHLGEVFKDVTHKISESVEEYLHPGAHELAEIFDSTTPQHNRTGRGGGGGNTVQASSERAPRSVTATLAEATSHPLPPSPGDSLRGSPVPFQGSHLNPSRDVEDVTSSSDDDAEEQQEASKTYRTSKEKASKAKFGEGLVYPTRYQSGVVEPRASPFPGVNEDGRKVFTPVRVTTHPGSASLGTTTTTTGASASASSVPAKVSPEYFRTGSPYGGVDTAASGTEDVFISPVGGGSGILTGAGGVEFRMDRGEGGELPGYPTRSGMSKLLRDRIGEDRVRASEFGASGQGVQATTNTTTKVQTHAESTSPRGSAPPAQALLAQGVSRVDSSASTTAVRGSSSDLRLLDDNENTPTEGGTPSGLPLPSRFSGNRTPRLNVEVEKPAIVGKGSKQQEFEKFFPAAGKPIN